MKKHLTSFISLILVLLSAIALSACGGGSGGGGSGGSEPPPPVWVQYNDNVTYKLSYASEQECPNGNIVDGKLHSSTGFDVGKVYYMVVDFTITTFEASGWNDSFNASIKISPSTVIKATLEEAATGNFTERIEYEATNITMTYSIPEIREEARDYRYVLQLKIENAYRWVGAELAFYGDGERMDNVAYTEEFMERPAEVVDFTYRLDGNSYTVTGSNKKYPGHIVIPKEYNNKPVTAIADNAFKDNCLSLCFIYIPQSVSSIGDHAFENCVTLDTIAVSSSNKTFHSVSNCIIETESKTLLLGCENSVIPTDGSVTAIGEGAFRGCMSLTSITIPSSVSEIGKGAFSYCGRLESITLPFVGAALDGDTNTHFGHIFGASSYSDNAKHVPSSLKTVTITGGTSIEAFAFYGCNSIANITISDSVTAFGNSVFDGCSGLTSIKIPFVGETEDGDDNTHFGYIFGAGNYSDNSDSVPASLKTVEITGGIIDDYAFDGCGGITSITLGSGVTEIGVSAFSYCISLERLTVQAGNTVYRSSGNCIIDNATKTLIAGCKGSVIPEDGSVTAIGSYAFYGCNTLTDINIPGAVTEIGDSAFLLCTGLTNVIVPESATEIGKNAFGGCYGLTSITVPFVGATVGGAADTHFGYIFGAQSYSDNSAHIPSKLKAVIISGNAAIAENAFYGCGNLTDVTVGSGVTGIGERAFYGCNSLISMTLPFVGKKPEASYALFGYIFGASDYMYNADNVPKSLKSVAITGGTVLPDNAFYKCENIRKITLPDGLIRVGSSAFHGCSSLTGIALPDGVTEIGGGAFRGSGLYGITIGENVTSIGGWAFYGCTGLDTVYWNATECKSAGSYTNPVFDNCYSFRELVFGAGVRRIPDFAFADCNSLVSVTIPDGVTSIGDRAFIDCTDLKKVYWNAIQSTNNSSYPIFVNCPLLSEIIIGDGVKNIPAYGFASCFGLKSITIPNSVTDIGILAFRDCSGLTSITLGEGITEIRESTFSNCSGMTSITIGSNITKIGINAFYGCSSLESVIFENTSEWRVAKTSDMTSAVNIDSSELTHENAATLLTFTYRSYFWQRG